MRTPKVGDVVYKLAIGNRSRGLKDKDLIPVTVKHVGRKYFTVGDPGPLLWSDVVCHLTTWTEKTHYSANWRIYASPQEFLDEMEGRLLREEIRVLVGALGYGANTLPLPTLREIARLLKGAK